MADIVAAQPVTEMVARAARAIDAAAWKPHDRGIWDGEYEARRVASIIAARAAIGALREPSLAMLNAAAALSSREFGHFQRWQAMIDAALDTDS